MLISSPETAAVVVQVGFLPEYRHLLPNALSLYMRLPPSHINRSQSDFIVDVEVDSTAWHRLSSQHHNVFLHLGSLQLLIMSAPGGAPFQFEDVPQVTLVALKAAMVRGRQRALQVAGAGYGSLANSVLAQTALQVELVLPH